MRTLKAVLIYLAADVLCMFINITFSAFHNALFRMLCSVCTAGIMLALIGNYALSSAASDAKAERTSGSRKSIGALCDICGILAVPVLSWGVLLASLGGSFDFYRWHKVLNGGFLRMINFIEPDASSSAVSMTEALLMLPFVLIPVAAYTAVYMTARSKSQ